jgi:CTP:phosphocholine cytidylyltransferase-like protein
MKVIIIAAGRGSGVKDLTDERPNYLVVLRGNALLERQLDALKEACTSDIAIVT